jgi:quinol monooxygenase YgiN
MIRYKVKPDRVADNEAYVRKVYEELKRSAPAGLRYATFRLDDGVSFVHLVSYESETSNQALTALPAFKAFTAQIKERCEEQPATVALTEVGSYRFFDS